MSGSDTKATLTYSGAAWLVIIGVVAGWFFLKQNTVQASVDLPQIPDIAMLTSDAATVDSLMQQAEVAYAAGRITRPKGDSALDYYRQQLSETPDHEGAQEGVKRVTAYLVNGAETALRREDWNAARDLAREARSVSRNSTAVASILERIGQHDKIVKLSELAHEQINQDQLTQPEGDNALESYRAILKLDSANASAKQGVELIAQRLASLAQSEAFADNTQRARALIEQARSIAPNAPGIEAAQKLTKEWTNLTNDQAVKADLLAAAKASQAGRLLSVDEPGQLGALELFESALAKDPTSQAAQAGVSFVIGSVVDRAWNQLAAEEFEQAEAALAQLDGKDADTEAVLEELNFLQRRQSNRAGEFSEEDFVAISELKVKRRVLPTVAQENAGGTVELAFTVDEDGEVSDIEVINAANAELSEAAMDALARWKFSPYLWEGRELPVRTGMIMRIET